MDVSISRHGSIFLVTPRSDAAQRWLAGNLSGEVSMFGSSVAVEPRFIVSLVEGMENDGLSVAQEG